MEPNKDKNIELIRKSFESKNSKAPEFVWENIDKKLYVERVWIKLKDKLDKIQRVRTAIRIFMYSTAILLLIGLVGTYYLSQKLSKTNSIISRNNLVQSAQNIENESLPYFSASEGSAGNQYADNSTRKMPDMFSEKNSLEEISAENSVIIPSGQEQNQFITGKIADIQADNSANNSAIIPHYTGSRETGLLYRIPPYKINTINYSISKLPLQYVFAETKLLKKKKLKRNELGVLYSLNSTAVIDNDFVSGSRDGSLISLKPTFASEYGLIYKYNFSVHNAVSAEFFFISNHDQNVYLYSGGRYYKKTTELDYSKLVVSYQRNIRFDFMIPDSWYFVKAGGYFAVLTKDNIYYVRNDEKTELPYSVFSKNDYGVNICLGREFILNDMIVAGAGLRSEYGFKNIFEGDANLPSDFNRTNNFSYGLFVSVKMKF